MGFDNNEQQVPDIFVSSDDHQVPVQPMCVIQNAPQPVIIQTNEGPQIIMAQPITNLQTNIVPPQYVSPQIEMKQFSNNDEANDDFSMDITNDEQLTAVENLLFKEVKLLKAFLWVQFILLGLNIFFFPSMWVYTGLFVMVNILGAVGVCLRSKCLLIFHVASSLLISLWTMLFFFYFLLFISILQMLTAISSFRVCKLIGFKKIIQDSISTSQL
eukprot:TRINITY_DN209_c0_g1_i1.p1 TRINITY_DN209_c0_g1~~TRINITY_DN209_c0_g1_i1.p1  ORF type:complete len:215 (+),score=29.92 TRINITY_DN209_c0_g1_i1:39-683(+)